MTNPKATLHMANGADIVIELLPQAAPNTVNSFIYAASHGYLDHHAIERIVPGNWVDVSYTAFGHKELQYLIPVSYTHLDVYKRQLFYLLFPRLMQMTGQNAST